MDIFKPKLIEGIFIRKLVAKHLLPMMEKKFFHIMVWFNTSVKLVDYVFYLIPYTTTGKKLHYQVAELVNKEKAIPIFSEG